MAKLFVTMQDEKGTERHKTAHKELSIKLYCGSRENSVLAIDILAAVDARGNFTFIEKSYVDVQRINQAGNAIAVSSPVGS